MTSIRILDKEYEERHVAYGPSIVGVGMLLASVAVTLRPAWTWLPLVLVVSGIAKWVQEAVRDRRTMHPPEQASELTGNASEQPTLYWYGAAGFAFVQGVTLVAALRVVHAHGLLHPDLGPRVLDAGLGLGATLVALAGVLVGAWGAWESSKRGGGRVARSLVMTALVAAGLLAIVVAQAVALTEVVPPEESRPRLAALLWLFGIVALTVFAALVALLVTAARAAAGHVPREPWGIAGAVLLHWWVTVAGWLFVYAFLYLRLFTIEARLI